MSSGIAGQALETCEVVWWSGYVRGRFQAYTRPPSLAPELIDESPTIRWRSSSPPGPVEPAVAALEVLTRRLEESGWVVAGQSEETWYGLVLARPSTDADHTSGFDDRPHTEPHRELPPPAEQHLDAALLAQLRSELREARAATEVERTRRIEAETGALRLLPAQPEVPARRRTPFFVAYAASVVAVTAIVLVGLDSVYAALDAGLTTAAVAVALDSWLIVHRRRASEPAFRRDRVPESVD